MYRGKSESLTVSLGFFVIAIEIGSASWSSYSIIIYINISAYIPKKYIHAHVLASASFLGNFLGVISEMIENTDMCTGEKVRVLQ